METQVYLPSQPLNGFSAQPIFPAQRKAGYCFVCPSPLQLKSSCRLRCAKYAEEVIVEKLRIKELNIEEDEVIGMRNMNQKCRETVGIVELLECLEREAIMGENEGRDPTDYNRRALIFDRSSRVFQALRQDSAN